MVATPWSSAIGFCHAVDHGTEEIYICYLSSSTYLELTVEVVVAGYQVAQADSDERYSQSMNLKTGFWTWCSVACFLLRFLSLHTPSVQASSSNAAGLAEGNELKKSRRKYNITLYVLLFRKEFSFRSFLLAALLCSSSTSPGSAKKHEKARLFNI